MKHCLHSVIHADGPAFHGEVSLFHFLRLSLPLQAGNESLSALFFVTPSLTHQLPKRIMTPIFVKKQNLSGYLRLDCQTLIAKDML